MEFDISICLLNFDFCHFRHHYCYFEQSVHPIWSYFSLIDHVHYFRQESANRKLVFINQGFHCSLHCSSFYLSQYLPLELNEGIVWLSFFIDLLLPGSFDRTSQCNSEWTIPPWWTYSIQPTTSNRIKGMFIPIVDSYVCLLSRILVTFFCHYYIM